MRLGEGTLENGDAKDIRDKHNVSMATSKWRSPPAPSHRPNRSVEIKYSTHLPKKGWGRNKHKAAYTQNTTLNIVQWNPAIWSL